MEVSKIKLLIWIFPLVFLIHDLEEIATIENFTMRFPFSVSTEEFIIAFILLWIIVVIGCVKAANNKRFIGILPIKFFALLVAGVFLANGIGHVVQSIILKKYVPGVITAVAILIPFCLFSIRKLLLENLITPKQVGVYLLVGFILQTPFALIALLIAKFIV
ncbi:HXXEE domain-containing protein [Viridibacillus sp. FSL H8-0110]|uniref:HXXEE domain-containing protein n=1 Tax=Viridibacillus sp. FSL H8-0110 TaxID=2921376 RepID=UPI0030FAA9CB